MGENKKRFDVSSRRFFMGGFMENDGVRVLFACSNSRLFRDEYTRRFSA